MLTWNGVDMSQYFSVNDIRGRSVYTRNLDLISVTNMPGAYLQGVTEPPRLLEIDITIKAKNLKELRQKIDEINGIMVSKEPVPLSFSDEPDKTYYGMTEAITEDIERDTVHKTTINVLCLDPYKYGPEKVVQTESGTFIVENEGTAEAKPIIELTVKEPVTFAMISDGERYNMIGRPADVEQNIVDERILKLEERGETLSEWTSQGTAVDGGNVSGQFGYDGTGITVASHGTGERWHGPAVMREIIPIQDFEVEMICQGITDAPDDTFRMEFYLYDEYFNILGKMAVLDNNARLYQIKAEGRVGPFMEHFGSNYLITEQNYSYHGGYFYGLLRFRRVGNRFELYVTRLDNNLRHINSYTASYVDTNNQYAGRLRYVQIHTGMFAGTQNPYSSRINMIRAYELKQASEDQTPYIAYPGDVITFDHTTNELLLNGEDVKRLKDLGGEYFDLPKGLTTLTVMPDGTFDTTIRFKPRYR